MTRAARVFQDRGLDQPQPSVTPKSAIGKHFGPYGCHVDLNEGEAPDDCVLNEGHDGCTYAHLASGRKRRAPHTCPHWKPVMPTDDILEKLEAKAAYTDRSFDNASLGRAYRQAAAEIKALRATVGEAGEALKLASRAMNGWLCTYADDETPGPECDAARAEVTEHGTILYISEVHIAIDRALSKLVAK